MGKSAEMTPLSDESLLGRRVLVADDAAPTRWSYVGLLRDAGARVTEARDGVEALELARAQRPDLILADMGMPRLDGLGLCAALREEPSLEGIAVVLLADGEPPQAIWGSDDTTRPVVEAVLAALTGHEPVAEQPPVEAPAAPSKPEPKAVVDHAERENMRAQSTVAMHRDPANHVSHMPDAVWRLRSSTAPEADGSASGFGLELQARSRILGFGFVVLLAATVGLIAWRLALSPDGSTARFAPTEPPLQDADVERPSAPAPGPDARAGLTAFSGALVRGVDPDLGAAAGQGALRLEGPDAVRVSIDGVDHGALPLSAVLAEGRHVVRYRFEQGVTDRFYYVKAGATRRLEVITRPGGFVDAR
jgi:CheY-like chemotaxis protein